MAKEVNAPKVGEEAPDYTMKSHLDTEVKLSDFRGKKNVVMAFYPLAFTPV
jgi:peroxiredoxin